LPRLIIFVLPLWTISIGWAQGRHYGTWVKPANRCRIRLKRSASFAH